MTRLTRTQGQFLTGLIHTLRPEWDMPGITAAVRAAVPLGSGAEVAVAACRVAADPESKTPGRIPQPGAHWQGTNAGKRPAPVMCPLHSARKAGTCPDCTAAATPPNPEIVARLRATLAGWTRPERADITHPRKATP